MSQTTGGVIERLECRRLLASAGDPDVSFGDEGFLNTGRSGPILPAPGSTFFQFDGAKQVQKRGAAGALITSFGVNGTATFPFENAGEARLLPDGKLLVIGGTFVERPDGPAGEEFLTRLNPDGTPDTSFGAGGTVNLESLFGTDKSFERFAVQSTGKIVLVVIPITANERLARLNADGSVDRTFDEFDLASAGLVAPIAVQADDKFILASDGIRADGTHWLAVRFNANGTLDTTFANNGYLDDFPAGIDAEDFIPQTILLLPGGSFLISAEGVVFKFHPDGTPDTSFHPGLDNRVLRQFGGRLGGFGETLVPTADGKLILWDFVNLTRLNGDGSLDESFGRIVAGNFDQGLVFRSVALTNGNNLLVSISAAFSADAKHAVNGVYKILAADNPAAPPAPVSLGSDGALRIVGSDDGDSIAIQDVSTIDTTSNDSEPTGDILALVYGKLGRFYDLNDVNLVSITAGGGSDRVELTSIDRPNTVSGGEGDDTIFGSDGPDSLSGNAGRDYIEGYGGNDRVAGNGGRDALFGGLGDDRILGGAGPDALFSYGGHDTLTGGGGDDYFSTEGGCVLHGNAGNDSFFVRNFTETIPHDTVFGDGGHDSAEVDPEDQLLSIEETLNS